MSTPFFLESATKKREPTARKPAAKVVFRKKKTTKEAQKENFKRGPKHFQ